jgi:hypothetical protein
MRFLGPENGEKIPKWGPKFFSSQNGSIWVSKFWDLMLIPKIKKILLVTKCTKKVLAEKHKSLKFQVLAITF